MADDKEPKGEATEPETAKDEPKAAKDEPKAAKDEPKAAKDEPKAAKDTKDAPGADPKPAKGKKAKATEGGTRKVTDLADLGAATAAAEAEARAAEAAAKAAEAEPAPAPEETEAKPEETATATVTDLADLGAAAGVAEPVALPDPKIDDQGRAYATGKRKDAVARVWVKPGKGAITVNGRDVAVYFARPTQQMIIQQPFTAANRADQYDVVCTVKGGGLSGQAGAVRHGISRALTFYEPELRPTLKAGGFLTRDSRKVERKKYGRAKARRSFQFSKR